MNYILLGRPEVLSRRHTGDIGNAHVQRRAHLQQLLSNQHNGLFMVGPLVVEATYNMPMQIKHPDNLIGKYYSMKPPLHFLDDMLLDVCNGVLFEDQAQVVRIVSKKVYSRSPSIEFSVYELRNEENKKVRENSEPLV